MSSVVREKAIKLRAVTGLRHVLPDFLIIGIKKGGTTSLHRYLRQHPLVRPPSRKEPRFFHAHWDRGPLWYRRFFPMARERRQHERRAGRPFVTFEASPTYLYWPEVPARVAATLPHARLVALLRNPVDRAFSDYQSLVRAGRETRSFEEAVQAELDLHERGAWSIRPHHDDDPGSMGKLLAFGLYAAQLERWWAAFPRDRLLVLCSEEFFADEAATVDRVVSYLGLPSWDGYDFGARNVGTYVDRVDPGTRERLDAFFAPHNEHLYGLLGRRLW